MKETVLGAPHAAADQVRLRFDAAAQQRKWWLQHQQMTSAAAVVIVSSSWRLHVASPAQVRDTAAGYAKPVFDAAGNAADKVRAILRRAAFILRSLLVIPPFSPLMSTAPARCAALNNSCPV